MKRAVLALCSALALLCWAAPRLAHAQARSSTTTSTSTHSTEHEVTAPGGVKVSAPDMKVDVDDDSGDWYLSPTWIVIGVLAVGVLVAIIVAASRGGSSGSAGGGGTTVIKS